MGCCFAPGCSHRGEECQLFQFPKCAITKQKWIKLIRRKDKSPTKTPQLCSCHFPNQDKKALPEIFAWNAKKRLTFTSPEKRKRTSKGAWFEASDSLSSSSLDETQQSEYMGGASDHSYETTDPVSSSSPVETPPSGNLAGVYDDSNETSDPLSSSSEEQAQPPTNLAGALLSHCFRQVSMVPLKDGMAVDSAASDVSTDRAESSAFNTGTRLQSFGKEQNLISLLKEENSNLQLKILDLEGQLKKAIHFQDLVKGCIVAQREDFFLQEEIGKLKKQLETKSVFSFGQICHKDELVSHFTGMPDVCTFNALVSIFDGLENNIRYFSNWKVTCLPVKEQIFMTLIKLKRNLSHTDLAVRFGVSETSVKDVVMTWVHALHHALIGANNSAMSQVPSILKNQKHLPACFKDHKNTRIVLDCTEMRAANPKLLSKHNKMFSSYKHYVTVKGLVGIAPKGTVTFVSSLYPGRTSDKDIVAHSKVLDTLKPGDSVMADKGFLKSSLLPEGVTVNLPPFKESPQFTREQVEVTYKIAKSRIHVERAIRRIKEFRILDFIPQYYFNVSSVLFQVCAALTNFKNDLIREDENPD